MPTQGDILDSDPRATIWERADDNFCSWGYSVSERSAYIQESEQRFKVIEVLNSDDDPYFEASAIRVISDQKPPFGEWNPVEDADILDAALARNKAAAEARENSTEAEIERRKRHLESLPGSRYQELQESLDRAVFAYTSNVKSLIETAVRYMSTMDDSDLGEHFKYKFATDLFNYLAAIGTLRDIQRVVHRRVWPMQKPAPTSTGGKGDKTSATPSEWEVNTYGPKLKETFDASAAFLLKLRDYAIHYELPMPQLTTRMSWGVGQSAVFEKSFPLSRDGLLKWDAWSAPAKSFLKTQPEWIDLRELTSKYSRSVSIFHKWFLDEVAAALNLSEFRDKADELQLWLNEKDVRPDWYGTNDPIPDNWNEICRSVLRKKRIRAKIDRWAHGSRSWTVHTVDTAGTVTVGSSTGWEKFPM